MSTTKKDSEFRSLRDSIYTLFYYNNKPYVLTELALQFKNSKKADIEKVLSDLESKQKITIKSCGRTKIFYLSQDLMKFDAENSLEELKTKHEELSERLKGLREENANLNGQVEALRAELTTEEMKKRIEQMSEFVNTNKGLFDIKVIDKDEFNSKKEKQNFLKKIEATRNKIVKNIVNEVSDGIGMKKKDFLEEVGIED